jgi:predicted nucleotidyltransferase
VEQIRQFSTFSPKACMYHYLHMAKGNYREYLQGEQVKIKKYFYVLRPVLACEWIEKYHTMPPIEFDCLVDHFIPKGNELRNVIESLLVRKRAGEEMDYEPRINPINEFLDQRIKYYEQAAAGMKTADEIPCSSLDDLFRSVLRDVWKKEFEDHAYVLQ